MSTQTSNVPTVSRLIDDGDGDVPAESAGHAEPAGSGGFATGAALPLTLHHDHPDEQAADEGEQMGTGSQMSAARLTPVVARPVTVARLIDPGSGYSSIGALVGAQPLIHRSLQRSTERGGQASATSSTTVGSLAGPARSSTPAHAVAVSSSVGDNTALTNLGESVESASLTSLALPARRLSGVPASAHPRISRSVQRAAAQQLPAADLPLAPSRGPTQASIEATAMAVAQRAIDSRAEVTAPPAPESQPAPVQRSVVIDEVSPSTSSTGSSSGGGGALPQSSAELEQLATKLWGRLRLQLRRELLADRERAGMLTDLH
jgi:hypothetical protein